jgi:hypothetical protein
MSRQILEWEVGKAVPEEFLSLPHHLYRQDPYWLPENAREIASAFSPENPYFEQNKAHIWVVPEQVRLAGFYDPSLRIKEEKVAFFGFWETADAVEVNKEMFTAFEEWASALGATLVYGPVNFTTYGKYRIRLNLQPGEACFHGEPYNPPYYQALLEACGYTLQTHYQSQYIAEEKVNDIYARKEELIAKAAQVPFRFVHLQPDFWMSHLEEMYRMIDNTFRNNFAYAPVPFETFRQLYGESFARRICPHMSIAALNGQEQIIGFTICLPDYAPLCCQGATEPLQTRALNYEQHFPLLTSPTLLIKTLGVHPAYRNTGLMNAMGFYLMTHFKKHYHRAMACLMKSDNYSTYFFKDMGVEVREYGLYGKRLT